MFSSVVFFSESQIRGKVDRTFPNARNDIAWSIMMDADLCPYGEIPQKKYELGIVTIPKTKPNINFEGLKKYGVTSHHRKGFKPIHKILSS